MSTGGEAGAADDHTTVSAISQLSHSLWRRYQHFLDKTTPLLLYRWIFLAAISFLYALRVYFLQGFYIITYGLGIYVLQLLIAFLSPQVDPEIQEIVDGPTLPTRGSDEFRPFVRRLTEFKFWYSLSKAICIAFLLTFFSAFDVPVFWPALLFYWLVLFVTTMKRQIMHMIKYKYVPSHLESSDMERGHLLMKQALGDLSALHFMRFQSYCPCLHCAKSDRHFDFFQRGIRRRTL